MEVVSAELQPMGAFVERHVVIELEMLVVAIGERRRVAHGAEQAARRALRAPHVERIPRHALQSALTGEVDTGVQTLLAALHCHPSEANLVEEIGSEDVCVSG